jgi:hypothetical protein
MKVHTLKTSRFGPRRARSMNDIIFGGICVREWVHGTIEEKGGAEARGRNIALN